MKIFYGWRIVFSGGSLMFLQSMLLNQAFGAYLAVLVEERGWSKTAVAAASALKSTEAAVLGPFLGWGVDRFGAQGIIRFGIIMFGVGFMLLSQIETLLGFYGAFIVIALGSSMCSNVPINTIIIQWFERRRARALSALQFGMALGGIFVFVVAWSIQTFGWRATAFGSGVAGMLIGFPLAQVMRSRPEDIGETMDGEPPVARSAGYVEAPSLTMREALHTSAFWLISLGHMMALFAVAAVAVHLITHVKEELGYTLAEASLILSLTTVGQFFGVMMGWVMPERIDKRYITASCMLMHASGLLMLAYGNALAVIVAAALLHGTAWGLRGPFMQAMRADYFGRRSIGMILGVSALIIVFGQIGGPIIAGAFADWTGNYRTAFTVLAMLSGCGSICFLLAKPPAIRLKIVATEKLKVH
jgi:MFS family permease